MRAAGALFPPKPTLFTRRCATSVYVEGRNISFLYRSYSGQSPTLAELTQSVPEFVRQKPEVIVSPGGMASVRLLMEATSTIPIVMVTAEDAVENGLVTSLAHPAGHVTGLSTQSQELSTKRLRLLHEMLPSRTGLLCFWTR